MIRYSTAEGSKMKYELTKFNNECTIHSILHHHRNHIDMASIVQL